MTFSAAHSNVPENKAVMLSTFQASSNPGPFVFPGLQKVKINPRLNPENSMRRRNVVLGNMLRHGHLSQALYDSICPEPVVLNYSVENVYDIQWTDDYTYGDVFHQNEYEQSAYAFDLSDEDLLFELFDKYEAEAVRVIEKGYVHPAYDYVLKCSHTFNLLDARGAISVSQRTAFIGRVRKLARLCAECYLKQREELGYPMLNRGGKKA